MATQTRPRIGMRAFARIPRPDDDAVAALAGAGVTNVADAMLGMGVVDPRLRCLIGGGASILGPAITAQVTPGDGLLLRAAILVARPGDVLVVNAFGEKLRAVFGGAVAMHMKKRGIQAAIVDGAVRDVAEFAALGFPVFARSVSPRSGTTAGGCGEVNVPVAVGGVVVQPGDIVLGDDEGLVVVPRHDVGAVAGALDGTGHAAYDPAAIRHGLENLAPDAPVPGIAALRSAMAERGGSFIDACHDEIGDHLQL